MAIRLHDSLAVHPRLWLRAEIVEPAGFSVTVLAERLSAEMTTRSRRRPD